MNEHPRFRLRTFGGLSVVSNSEPSVALNGQRKALALLALLAVSGDRGLSRDTIFGLLWPESDMDQAQNALSQLLFRVRRELGPDAVVGTRELRLNPTAISCDRVEFAQAIANGRLVSAVELRDGPFLDGFYIRDAPDFERWCSDERRRLDDDFVDALETLAAAATAARDHQVAARWWRRRLDADRLNARAARGYAESLIAAGDRESARRFAATYAALIRGELGTEPDAELTRLLERAEIEASAAPRAHVPTPPLPEPVDSRVQARDATAELTRPESHARAQQTSAGGNPPRATRPDDRYRRWAVLGVATVVVLLSAVAFARSTGAPASQDADGARVLVVAFTNRSGDSTLDVLGAMAADWITQGLSESGIVNVVDGPTAFQVARSASRDSAGLDSNRVRLLAQRTGAGTVVWGAYYLVHDSIVFTGRVTDSRAGTLLRAIPPISASRTDPQPAIEALRDRAVGALATVAEPRLASLSGRSTRPPSIAAYREYLHGLDLFTRNVQDEARAAFLDAARQDSTFMLPLIWAYFMERSNVALGTGPAVLGDSLIAVLESHRSRLAPIDQCALDFFELERASAPKEDRLAAVRRVAALAPASNWSFIEASMLFSTGRAEEALSALRRIDPEHGWASAWPTFWITLSTVQHYLGDYRGELETLRRAQRYRANVAGRGEIPALIALGRIDSATARIRGLGGSALLTVGSILLAAQEARAHGYRAAADSLFRVALEWFRSPEGRNSARSGIYYARIAIEAGSLEEARRAALAVVADSATFPSLWEKQEAHGVLGIVEAERGDRPAAAAELRAIESLKTHNAGSDGIGASFQAGVAGAMDDRELVLRYLAEMEASTDLLEPAALRTHRNRALRWMDGDAAVRRPYIYGRPYADH